MERTRDQIQEAIFLAAVSGLCANPELPIPSGRTRGEHIAIVAQHIVRQVYEIDGAKPNFGGY